MDKDKLLEIIENIENKSNKDLSVVSEQLEAEFDKTKDLIISLTRHLDSVEKIYNDVSNEIKKRGIV